MARRILITIVILSLLLGAATLRRGHEWGDDWAWYVLQAKSLLTGTVDQFMATSAFTNRESTTYVGPLAYPWGYPLLLAPAYVLRGVHPLVLKLPGLVFYAAFLVSLYLLMRNRLDEKESLLVVALFAFSPLMLQFLDQILSDIPFLFFSTLSLWLMTREGQPGTLRSIAIGACIFCVVFIRATGILLLGSFLLAGLYRLLVHRRERETVKKIVLELLIAVLSFAVPFLLASLVFPGGGGSYLSQYAGMSVENIREFAVRYFEVYAVFFGAQTGWRYLYYVLVVFFLIGAWKHWRQDLVLLIFFALWMAVHIPYPYWQGPRYIFPLLPIFFYFTFQGMIFALRRLPERNARGGQRIFYGFWSIIIAAFLAGSTSTAVSNLQNDRIMNGPFDPYSREVYQYIQERTPAGSVVVFFKPRVMKLMTGRDSIMSMDCEHILNGDTLVLSRKVGPNQQIPPEQIDACSLPLNEVLRNNRFIVYEIQK